MTWATAILVYLVLWWLVFLAVLPWGVRPHVDRDAGHDAGAPVNPALLKKALITTAVAAVLFAFAYWMIESGIFDSLIHRG
jgi:predicted secreted protein